MISVVVPTQNFELIRDRVGEILASEIDNQATLSYEPYLELVTVEVERSIPVDKEEVPLVNISLAKNEFSNKHQGSEDGLITLNIDVYTSGKATEINGVTYRGDKISAIRCQKLLGLIRYILSDPIYKTLGFAAPSISRVYSGDINIKPIGIEDDPNFSMGRYTLNVVCNESNKLITPNLIAGFQTTVQLNNSDQGYFYEG